MPQPNQEYSAGRLQEFIPPTSPQPPRYDASYECEPPPDVRAELVRPRWPVILEPPRVKRSVKPDRSGILIWAGAVALVAIILAGTIGHYAQGLKQHATPKQSAPVAQPTPVPAQPVSQPPMPPPPAVSAPRARLVLYKRWAGNGVYELVDSTGRTVKILIDPAPRALLANPPAPRAELVQAHGPQGSEQAYSFAMPYDGSFEVQGVLRGYLSDVGKLPRTGNAIGDTWVVGNTPWVWITTPGMTEPTWIDP